MKKVTIENARPEHYKQILELIQKYLDPQGDWSRNKHIFDYKWDSMPNFDECSSGKVLIDEGKVVGYVGYIISRRILGARETTYINGTTLVIEPKYRNYLMKLYDVYLKKGIFKTAYDPRMNVERLLTNRFFNMKTYDENAYIFPYYFWKKVNGIKMFKGLEKALRNASKSESDLITDNCKYMAEILNFETDDGEINLIYRRFRLQFKNLFGIKICFAEVLYVSDKQIFMDNLAGIIKLLCKDTKSQFFLGGSRFFKNKPNNFCIAKKFKCFATDLNEFGINPEDIDDLYSEKTIVDFYTNPKIVKVSLAKLLGKKDLLDIS